MSIFEIVAVSLIGYMIGSIPFAVIIGKIHGIDIFKVGSGSPGATNIKRSISRSAGNLCFALDFLKGVAAAGWPKIPILGTENAMDLAIIGLFAAIIGHSFSIFIRFRGGKGVATTMGGLIVITPLVLIVGVLVWSVIFFAFRYVSLASLAFGISLPITSLIVSIFDARFWLCLALTVIIFIRHRSNIIRLLQGRENRFQ